MATATVVKEVPVTPIKKVTLELDGAEALVLIAILGKISDQTRTTGPSPVYNIYNAMFEKGVPPGYDKANPYLYDSTGSKLTLKPLT